MASLGVRAPALRPQPLVLTVVSCAKLVSPLHVKGLGVSPTPPIATTNTRVPQNRLWPPGVLGQDPVRSTWCQGQAVSSGA